MLYFVFIVLSTLRLDFWLSLWTGAVAAVQQLVLAFWLLPIEPAAGPIEHSIYYHASRSVMLMLAGLIAGDRGTRACVGNSRTPSRRRRRATASPTCSASMSRRPSSSSCSTPSW